MVLKANVCFEVSFECGNKVGGIYTVLSTKARKMKELYGSDYYAIGFFNKGNYYNFFDEREMPDFLVPIAEELKKMGIKVKFGRWFNASDVNLILLDTKEFEANMVNEIKRKLWEWYGVDSLRANEWYNEPVAWSYAAGLLIEKLLKKDEFKGKVVVSHFHEWLSGAGLLYLAKMNAPTALVFTTHATRIGREKSSRGENLFEEVEEGLKRGVIFDERKAYDYGLEAQHKLEKASAWNADVFTAVSKIVAEESAYILGKWPDVVTPNGWNVRESYSTRTLTIMHEKNRKKINSFLEAYFTPYYPVDTENNIIFFISGRYEFRNKGIDLFIKALARLNETLKKEGCEKTIFAFILVPSSHKGAKRHVLESMLAYREVEKLVEEELNEMKDKLIDEIITRNKVLDLNEVVSQRFLQKAKVFSHIFTRFSDTLPPVCSHKLSYDEKDDTIIKELVANGLVNKKEDKVKVIYYPSYLSSNDGLLNMEYEEFVNGASMGVFPSRYEPWGYTPFETAALRTLVATTDLAGFGATLLELNKAEKLPIKVISMRGKSEEQVIKQLHDVMRECVYMDSERRTFEKIRVRRFVEAFDWNNLIKHYIMAHNLAVERMFKRTGKNL